MSLYLGKDSNNKSMLVISKNLTSEAFIKNSLPSISNDYAIDTRRDLLFFFFFKVFHEHRVKEGAEGCAGGQTEPAHLRTRPGQR